MGTFTVEVTAKNPQEPTRSHTLLLLVDIVEALGVEPVGSRRMRFANGRADQWPIAIVLMTLEGQEWPTMCLVGPRGGPALLGAVTSSSSRSASIRSRCGSCRSKAR